jgi:hypothetical protein
VTFHRILSAIFCMVLFCPTTVRPVAAQESTPPRTFSPIRQWNVADETTFGAAIEKVIARNPAGTPSGLNLLMTGSSRILYVNLGPNLPKTINQSLTAGQVIQVTGIAQTFNGQNYLLARELQIGDQKIEIRNSQGHLTHPLAAAPDGSTRAHSTQMGGAR